MEREDFRHELKKYGGTLYLEGEVETGDQIKIVGGGRND